jgi:hypothetical protein
MPLIHINNQPDKEKTPMPNGKGKGVWLVREIAYSPFASGIICALGVALVAVITAIARVFH